MFICNRYTEIYYNLINTAKERDEPPGVIERHHIIPKSLGGNNDNDNIVKLTAREHFICHRLLVKMTDGNSKRKMQFALGKFVQNGPGQERILSSRQYNIARSAISHARRGKKHTEETKQKIREARAKQVITEEQKRKISETLISIGHRPPDVTGQVRSAETKRKMSAAKMGHTAGMTGKEHTEETKIKMSKNMKGARGPQKRIEVCPVCNNKQVTARHVRFCKDNK
jgi:hypothetical protein